MRAKRFLFEQKYRFDLGYRFLTILNFGLLVFAVSEDIANLLYISRIHIALIAVPLAFVGMWVFGYVMDKVVHAQSSEEAAFYKRSAVWTKVFKQLDNIEKATEWMPKNRGK